MTESPTKGATDSPADKKQGRSAPGVKRSKVVTRSSAKSSREEESEEDEVPQMGELRHLDSPAPRLDSSGLCTNPVYEKPVLGKEERKATAKSLKRLTVRFDWRNYVLYNEEDTIKDEI